MGSVTTSATMATCQLVLFVMVTFTVVMGEDVISDEVIRDMRELRREVEQLKNEVRRSREDRESDNNKIIIDWLTESVKEIQSEIRELVIKETEDKHFASVKDVENVRKELKKIKLNFEVEEEKHFAAIELIEFDLNHSKGGKKTAHRDDDVILKGKYRKHHRNLSKKHLQNWMIKADVKNSNMEDAIIELQQELIKIKADQKIFYQHLENKIENAVSDIYKDIIGKHF